MDMVIHHTILSYSYHDCLTTLILYFLIGLLCIYSLLFENLMFYLVCHTKNIGTFNYYSIFYDKTCFYRHIQVLV
jgi:hypothetical protein